MIKLIPFRIPRILWTLISIIGLIVLIAVRAMPTSDLASLISLPLHAAGNENSDYGFSTSLDSLTPDQLNAKLNGMQATGAKWVRFDVSWDVVQPNNAGSYNWATYDNVFSAIQSHGMNAVGVIDFTPGWARESQCASSKFCPPQNVAEFGNFAAAAAARYAPYGVHDWEIWNEANIAFRFDPAPNPALYTQMLKASYTDIKGAEPSDTVIVGGTAPAGNDADHVEPATFLSDIYANGGKGYFDAVAAHPYDYPNSPADGLPDAWGQMSDMHNVMAQNGDGNKLIWVTEFGSPTNGPNIQNDHVTEAQQAQILSDALRLWKTYSWAGPFFYYDYQDSGTSVDQSENFFGLLRADGSQKPAYGVWVKAISQN